MISNSIDLYCSHDILYFKDEILKRFLSQTKSNTSSTIDSDQNTFVHVPEIYLTRLLTTKGTLQHFVNDLFVSIFSLSNGDVPHAIKFLFDMLDRQAAENGITDPDIIHTWKNNRYVVKRCCLHISRFLHFLKIPWILFSNSL